MNYPTNRKQQQMMIGLLEALKAKRLKEKNYRKVSEIDKELLKIKLLNL